MGKRPRFSPNYKGKKRMDKEPVAQKRLKRGALFNGDSF